MGWLLDMQFSRVFYCCWCLLKPCFILPSAHLHQQPSFLFYPCIFTEFLGDRAVRVQGRGGMCAGFASAPIHRCVDIQFHRMHCWGSQEFWRQHGLLIAFERCEPLVLKRKKNYQLLLLCRQKFMATAPCCKCLRGVFF